MADKVKLKTFPTAFKLTAIKRFEAGEAVLPSARKPAFRSNSRMTVAGRTLLCMGLFSIF